MTLSLLRLRARMTRAPWRTRLLAMAMALSLVFALMPCCEVIGAAGAAPMPAVADHGQVLDAHADSHAPDNGDPCAAWLDRSDAVPPKADNAAPPGAKISLATPSVLLPNTSLAAAIWRPFRLSASPPHALYLRHARPLRARESEARARSTR
mgnify:CR=1 FL=1